MIKMSFFSKIDDIMQTEVFKYIFHRRSNKSVANISKITTFDKDVVASEQTLCVRSMT